MPPLPTHTYFLDPHTGLPLTKGMVVLLDPISGVLLLRKQLARQISGRLVQIGTPLDWNPDDALPRLSNQFVRMVFQHDPDKRVESVDSLRRELVHHVTTPPDEIAGQPYLVNHWGLAFPVQDRRPLIFRKGYGSSLATLTLYNIFAPSEQQKNVMHVMPHIVCIRPRNAWWTTVRNTIRELLEQHFPHLPRGVLDHLEVQRVDTNHDLEETVVKLSMQFPMTLRIS